MKTSKIIFVSLLSTIAVVILAFFIDVRILGRRDNGSGSDFNIKKHELKFFKVLYISKSMNVTLVKNDSTFLEVNSMKDSIAPKVNFSLREDTLRISDFEKTNHHNVSIRIYTGDSLRRILLKNADLAVEHSNFGALSLDMSQSSIWFNEDDKIKSHIRQLSIVANDHSHINTNSFYADSINIVLRNSEANLETISKKLTGSLSDSSRIQARQPQEIWLKKDGTSKININDY